MKTEKSNFLGTFVLAKLPKKLTSSQWFTVVPQILFQTLTAHFYKGEMAIFYSPKSANQLMLNITRNWAAIASFSLSTNTRVRLSNAQIKFYNLNQF